MQIITKLMHCKEEELTEIKPYKTDKGTVEGVIFLYKKDRYIYRYGSQKLIKM